MAMFNKPGAGVLGNDPQELQAFAAFLEGPSTSELRELLDGIDRKITSTTWQGPDATRFEQEWADTRQRILTQLTDTFQRTATDARRNADDQTTISN